MNKKRIFSFILALLLAASLLTSCGDGTGGSGQTEGSSSAQEKDPVDAARDFADRLQNALQHAVRSDIRFEIREKHQYSTSSVMEKVMFAKWQSDFSDSGNPRFLYSMQRNPKAEKPELLLFYDEGFFYVKDSASQYRQPSAFNGAKDKIPYDGITALFGDGLIKAFREAKLTQNPDETVTATAILSLFDDAATVAEYLTLFGVEASGHEYGMDGDPCEAVVSVCMDGDRLLSYTMETVMAGRDSNREIYPVTYTVKAVYQDTESGFVLTFPDAEARADYMEAEPEITDINAEEFLKRFEKSDEKSNAAVYTQMITNSAVTYEFSENYWVKIPILNVTAVDLSKPRAPKISIVESKLDAMGIQRKKEMYYRDDTYYYTENGQRFAVPYPAEEYLANVEAAAKEKAEAGITSFFLNAEMLENALFTVGPDQTVSAVMDFDGTSQEKNIFYHIKSVYNDDLANMQRAEIQNASLALTLDRFNYLTSYTLTVTAEIESNGTRALATYAFQYSFDYSEMPREITFPADLDGWGSSSGNI